jgi:hypothetical protein
MDGLPVALAEGPTAEQVRWIAGRNCGNRAPASKGFRLRDKRIGGACAVIVFGLLAALASPVSASQSTQAASPNPRPLWQAYPLTPTRTEPAPLRPAARASRPRQRPPGRAPVGVKGQRSGSTFELLAGIGVGSLLILIVPAALVWQWRARRPPAGAVAFGAEAVEHGAPASPSAATATTSRGAASVMGSPLIPPSPPAGDPRDACNLGVLLENHGDREGAEAAFRRADQRGDAKGAFNLGVLLSRRGDFVGAIAAFVRADQRGDAKGAFNLGVLLDSRGDLAGAKAAYARADQRGDLKGALSLAVLLDHQGDPDGAEAAYARAEQRGDSEEAQLDRDAPLEPHARLQTHQRLQTPSDGRPQPLGEQLQPQGQARER